MCKAKQAVRSASPTRHKVAFSLKQISRRNARLEDLVCCIAVSIAHPSGHLVCKSCCRYSMRAHRLQLCSRFRSSSIWSCSTALGIYEDRTIGAERCRRSPIALRTSHDHPKLLLSSLHALLRAHELPCQHWDTRASKAAPARQGMEQVEGKTTFRTFNFKRKSGLQDVAATRFSLLRDAPIHQKNGRSTDLRVNRQSHKSPKRHSVNNGIPPIGAYSILMLLRTVTRTALPARRLVLPSLPSRFHSIKMSTNVSQGSSVPNDSSL